jgi:hypothetical protein
MPKVPTLKLRSLSRTLASRLCAAALLTATALAVSGCVTAGPILAEAGNCSGYIPQAWREPVPGAELPEGNTVGDWISFADREAAQLDKANGRMADTLRIVGECEKRAARAVERSRPKVLGVF